MADEQGYSDDTSLHTSIQTAKAYEDESVMKSMI